ncbi:leucine-rich repeat-containing protein [Tanacetum coccineum]
MRENIYFYFMRTQILFILSLVLLWFNTTTATLFGRQQQLVAAAHVRAAHTCIDKERQALLDFKAPIHDPRNMLSTWRHEEEDDCCQWLGVTCNNQTGHVTELDLSQYGFGGEISLSLLNLTYLNYLDLFSNSFHGTISMFICSIGSLTSLTCIDLSENKFSGVIPESIGSLTSLTYLDLSENNFSGTIPREFGNLTNLEYLYNNFSGTIPMSIGSLTKLTSLSLSNNKFQRQIGNLTNLQYLHFKFPRKCVYRVENLDWLSSLSSLEELKMDGTSLAKANNWVNVIIGLQNLSTLSLVGCDLSHVMHPYSSSVNSSSSINYLYLQKNNLNSPMYSWLCPLFGKNLGYLVISGNTFDGNLSDFLNTLSTSATTLEILDASSNQFTGSLSDEIQNFSFLKTLNLSLNQLNGTISDKLWQLPNLQTLYLSSSSLTGAISENMLNLSQSIQFIDFSSNKLGPRFPKWIQTLKNLIYLDLSNNSISDTVSTEYWNRWKSSQLSYLDLSFNNISGKLPKSLSNHDLYFIDLSFNCFYGPIPAFPAGISFLDLSRNKFHGGLSFLCQLYENLEFLDISRNTITGQLPDCFRNLTYLKVLNLGHNILSGRIPPSIGYLGQLETLCLYNNSFSGELPLNLKNCTKLSLLDLGANILYGNIPVWIGKNMSRLYALSLKSNNLFGTIPSQICQLESLHILDLSFNNLHGTIPPSVNNLTSMVQKGTFLEQNKHHYHSIINSLDLVDNSYIDHMLIEWQGKVNEFSSILGLLKAIDLSSNNLTGQIPNEVTNLHGLLVLDLSNNSLVGGIPRNIGHMTELLTLNLSRNMFSGEMPSSMCDMYSLNDLDVSFNNLSGRVPTSTQLQSFEPTRFIGNAGLCGLPTTKKCPGDEYLGVPNVVKSESDGYSTDETQRWFYVGGATGFATGFCIDLELIANAEALNKYNQVMNFLLRVKRAKFVLDEARRWVWKPTLCSDGTVSTNNARCEKEVDRIKKQFDDCTAFFLRLSLCPTGISVSHSSFILFLNFNKFPSTMSQTVVLKVGMSCCGCVGGAWGMKRVLAMEGVDVETFDIDLENQKVTVKGNVQPDAVLQTVSKTGKKTEFWPAEGSSATA